MALDSDQLLERRRMRRRLNFWRIAAVIAVAAVVVVGIGRFAGFGGAYVAVLDVRDVIFDDVDRIHTLDDVAKDSSVRALLVRINSPGGTVVGGETLFNALRRVAAKKPIVAVIEDLGTSAAYMTALGTDHIVAHQGSVTGSIGVLMQTTEFTGLMEKLGISAESIKSAPLKGQPNPFEPLTAEARAATQAVVNDVYNMFVEMVADRRDMPMDEARKLADGRVYTGRQALANGLIDEIGSEREAREWLDVNHGVPTSLPSKPVKIKRERGGLAERFDDLFGKTLFSERLRLDGLVSVWHPSAR